MACHLAAAPKAGRQVGVQGGMPRFAGHLYEWLMPRHGRIADKEVDPAESPNCLRDHAYDVLFAGDVYVEDEWSGTCLTQFRDKLRTRWTQICHRKARSFFGQDTCDASSDPARGAGYEGDLT